ncbi:hypothetical protein AVEN_121101-1 [Araneus ventricosus]|uniref:Uncharacterized protein n=1 Tax=Araneus ventricosus TaxID=182803 RepID=A0A4Y2S8U9_ARAVE|nr:hypothetical protein AVEN_44205-1 [Araneus ventricosus]GBN84457.1 hypothetical protein AVEN_121101-1 [Araneus ventricosus]
MTSPFFATVSLLIIKDVVHRAPSYSVMFISQYPPPARENSFCLVDSILDTGSIGLRLKSAYFHSGDPKEHETPTFNPTTRWQHQKNHINSIYYYIQQMAALQLLYTKIFQIQSL